MGVSAGFSTAFATATSAVRESHNGADFVAEVARRTAELAGQLLAFVARLITGAQGHWKGCPPKAEQRIYFANHQSHLDWVLIWAALPPAADANAGVLRRRVDAIGGHATLIRANEETRRRVEVFHPQPAGVAALQPGDTIACGVDGVGTLNVTIGQPK